MSNFGALNNTGTLNNSGRINGIDSVPGSFTQSGSAAITTNTGTFQAGSISISGGIFYQNDGSLSADSLVIESPGTLSYAGGTISITSGTLTDNGTLLVNPVAATTLTISPVIAGTGALTKSGAGTLILSGINTFTGATNLDGGTLRLSSADNLQGTSGLSFDGGTLAVTSSLSLDKPIALGASGGTFDTGSNTLTLGGAITGSGSLGKSGSGTLVLTNTGNTYSGITAITGGTLRLSSADNLQGTSGLSFDGGTLAVTSSLSLDKPIALGASGGTFDTGSNTLTLGGAITGSGSLGKSGSGTLVLTNTGNTYSGITAITGGTLQAGAANVFSPNSVVVLANTAGVSLDLNNYNQTIGGLSGGGTTGGNVSLGSATLTVNQSSDTSYAGVISGTGTLKKTGSGTLVLTGTNTYSGGTILAGGTLSAASDASLGAATGALTFDGGTLRTLTGFTSARTIDITSGGTLDNGGNGITLAGVLTGTGPLSLTGTGTDTLGTSFDGSGFTGTLAVANGATLAGVGTVHNLSVAGAISPGYSPGTITATGNYLQTATGNYICQVTPTANDLIAVTGSASLAGTLTLQPEYTFYNSGTTWTVLTAGGGVSGAYSTVVYGATPENWVFTPHYTTGNSVVVTLTRQSYSSSATSAQSSATGTGLDSAAYSATGNMATLIQYLDYSYGFDSNAAAWSVAHNALTNYVLNVLSPEPYDAFTQILFDGGRLLTSVQRAGLYGGEPGGGDAFASPTDIGPANRAGIAGSLGTPRGVGEQALSIGGENGLGVFLTPLGMLSGQKGSSDRTGYFTQTGGLTGGMRYSPSAAWTFALAPGFVTQSVTLHTEGGGKGWVQDWSLALLGRYKNGGWHADIGARAGYNAYEARRDLPLPTYSGTAKATWNGWNTSLSAGGGYDCTLGAFDLGPFASVQWQRVHEDGFRESRVGTLGQSLRVRNANALTTNLGGRVSRTFTVADRLAVTPEVRAAWRSEWLSNPRYLTSSFIGSTSSAYHAAPADQRYHSLLLDAGVTMHLKDRLSVSAKAGVELFRPGHEAQTASVGLTYSF